MSNLTALLCALGTFSVLALAGCTTHTLQMPAAQLAPSALGPVIEVSRVTDVRAGSTLGKVDTVTIDSGADLAEYVEVELVNALSGMGLTVRQGSQDGSVGLKRVEASLIAAQLECESTLMYPVVATVRLRVELIDELGRTAFAREFRGSASQDLGYHRQGGQEDARLLADVVTQAVTSIAKDKAFVAAAFSSPGDAAQQPLSEEKAPGVAGGSEQGSNSPIEPISEGPSGAADTTAEQLRTLDRLLEEGLIDQDDYTEKRQEILRSL